MKYLLLLSVILVCLAQCKKQDSTAGNTINTNFDVQIDPNYLIDTVSYGFGGTINGAYFFKYDNSNRVTSVKEYSYFFNQLGYILRGCTFSYSGNNILPQSMEGFWANQYYTVIDSFRIYFYYNPDKSKNRDSIIDLHHLVPPAVRKYTYDSALRYVTTKYFVNGSSTPAFKDSSVFDANFNTTLLVSTRTGNATTTQFTLFDAKINPFTRLNIFPAMFMSNYILYGNLTDNELSNNNFLIDFSSKNNVTRERLNYGNIATYTIDPASYDVKNRIVLKQHIDSVNGYFNDAGYIKYTYKN